MGQSRPEGRDTRAGTEVSYSRVPHAAADRVGQRSVPRAGCAALSLVVRVPPMFAR